MRFGMELIVGCFIFWSLPWSCKYGDSAGVTNNDFWLHPNRLCKSCDDSQGNTPTTRSTSVFESKISQFSLWSKLSSLSTPIARSVSPPTGLSPSKSSPVDSLPSVSSWLLPPVNVTVIRNLSMDGVHTGFVNARSTVVFVTNLTPTSNVPNVKIKVRTILGQPSPNINVPLIVSVTNLAGGQTFQVPSPVFAANGSVLFVQDHQVRYLCPLTLNTTSVITITVSTGMWISQNEFYKFEIQLMPVGHWWLQLGQPQLLHASSTDPAVFEFRWTDTNHNDSNRTTAEDREPMLNLWPSNGLIIKISSQQHSCLTVVVQPRGCPITVVYPDATSSLAASTAIAPRFRYFNVYGDGVLSLDRTKYKDGFIVNVLVQQTDSLCAQGNTQNITSYPTSRKDTVEVLVATRCGYSSGLIMMPIVLAVTLVVSAVIINRLYSVGAGNPNSAVEADLNNDERSPENAAEFSEISDQANLTDSNFGPSTENIGIECDSRSAFKSTDSLNLFKITTVFIFTFVWFSVSNIIYRLYTEHLTGNLDLCYRNNLCRDPVLLHSTLGKLLSSLPYIGASIGVYLSARLQEHKCLLIEHDRSGTKLGVNQNFFLIKNMAFVLFCQSFFVVINSQCPNPVNQHMDMILVYLVLSLFMYKVLTTRRPSSLLTPLTPLMVSSWWFGLNYLKSWLGNNYWSWSMVSIANCLAVSYLSLHLYTDGGFTISLSSDCLTRVYNHLIGGRKDLKHLLTGILTINVFVFITALIILPSDISQVAVLLCSTLVLLQISLYLVQKWRYGEIIVTTDGENNGQSTCVSYFASILLFLGSILILASVCVIFIHGPTVNVEMSSSQSRALARQCLFGSGASSSGDETVCHDGGLFDESDLFHMLMPAAISFLVNGFLLIDVDVKNRPQSQLPIF